VGGVAATHRPVAIALGSNLGDRRAALAFAVDRLSRILFDLTLSDIVETDPEGEGPEGESLEGQPRYLNAAVTGTTTLDARALLGALLSIEADYGRARPYRGAPRTLDLDLVLLADDVIDEPGLHVPHPRFRDRFFVLGPLAEIAPDMRDPVTGLRVGELLKQLLRNETK
jgi:2-amino-4-hydroxy-6-hydroxymethyldihydropteridine diphosphokinase